MISKSDVNFYWKEYYPKVYGYFYRRVESREDVEDLTSIVMTSFVQGLQSTKPQNLHGYLWRIAHNQLVNYIKNKNKNRTAILSQDADWILDQSIENLRSTHFRQKMTNLLECIKNNLKGFEQELFEQVIIQEIKIGQIAKNSMLKANTLSQQLSRAIKKLKIRCRQIWLSQ